MKLLKTPVALVGNMATDTIVTVHDYGGVTELVEWVGSRWNIVSLTAAQRTELAYLLVTGKPMPRVKS